MAYKEIHQKPQPSDAADLAQRLEQEWQTKSNAPEPSIIVHRLGANQPVHLYVIWEAWRTLSLQERSELIMDVYERVTSRAEAANVTVAMGLTREEAERLVPSLVRAAS